MSNFCFKDNKKKEECKFFMQEQKKILVCGICKPTSFVKKIHNFPFHKKLLFLHQIINAK